ncbi:Hypothetical_protein [Hexamita inflata]|uniref:Hypothetical_protein n=1 Tax=Hexamita inflata TaxID=28002 RepID=A0AA86PWG9_9EUKA|nr:Hypothetical protein HINF_LOCUS35179 [Hexamita inflata]
MQNAVINSTEFNEQFLLSASNVLSKITKNHYYFNGTCIASEIMQLSECNYDQFWRNLQSIMNISTSVLQHFFVYNLVPLNMIAPISTEKSNSILSSLASSPQSLVAEQSQQSKCFRSSVTRQKSYQQTQFQNLFALSIKKLILMQTNKDIDQLENTQLCVYVNQFLKNYPKQQFWTMLSELIAGKTARQLYDYYTNSFSKFLYSGQLSTEDKTALRALNEQMADQKPSVVAQRFLDTFQTQQYFKHNVIMYVVNLRK